MKFKNLFLFFTMLIGLVGCFGPEKPDPGLFVEEKEIRPGLSYITTSDSLRHGVNKPIYRGNAILLVADKFTFNTVKGTLAEAADKPVMNDIDELAWWEFAPHMAKMYKHIVRIGLSEAKNKAFKSEMERLEALGEPFDVFILSHGMPNYLSSGEGYFFSYKDLEQWRGKFKNLNLVFSQSCFGSSLVSDWQQAGAKHTISFRGMNRNFFWLSYFLQWYRYYSIEKSFIETNSKMNFFLNTSYFKLLINAFGKTVEEYLSMTENPELM